MTSLCYPVIGAVQEVVGPARACKGRRCCMATYVEGRGLATEAEPLGLLSEGAAGIAAIVLAVIALAGISAPSSRQSSRS